MPKIALINHSTVVTRDELLRWAPSLERQLREHVTPAWPGMRDLHLEVYPDGAPLPTDPHVWPVGILDTSDEPGAGGYHDVMTPGGQPLGKVFAKTVEQAGMLLSVTISHELCEMGPDPEINRTIAYRTQRYAVEICDPVEADAYSYDIDGVRVSDFVLPAYYGYASKHARYDYCGKVAAPRTLLHGGYVSWQTANGQWHQKFSRRGLKPRPGTSGRSSYRRQSA